MKKRNRLTAGHYTTEIEGVTEEYLDWKDVYAGRIPEGSIGVVIFAVNDKNDVFIEWRFENKNIKQGAKTTFDDGSEHGISAQVVWVDNWPD